MGNDKLLLSTVLDAAQCSKGLIVVWDVWIVDCRWHSAPEGVSWLSSTHNP